MTSTAQTILKLTLEVADAAAEGDLALCDRLLTERGEALRILSDMHAAAGGGTPPADVREILATVEQMDARLERTWTAARDTTGAELDRIAGRAKQKHGTEAPCILDRQA